MSNLSAFRNQEELYRVGKCFDEIKANIKKVKSCRVNIEFNGERGGG